MKRTLLLLCTLVIGLITTFGHLLAQIPGEISYQGYIEGGTGPVDLDFRLYPSEVGGSVLWSEHHSNVELDKSGIFSVLLGSATPLTPVNFDRPLYLEIAIDGNTVAPRTKLTSTPFAYRAQISNGVADDSIFPDDISLLGDSPINGDVLSFDASSGKFKWVTPSGGGGGGITVLTEGDGIRIADQTGPNATISIAPKGITTAMLADSAVTGVKIKRASIDSNHLQNGSVTASKLAPNVGMPLIGNAGGALTGVYPNPSIADTAVKESNIAANAVTSVKIKDKTIVSADIGDEAINAEHINPLAEFVLNQLTAKDSLITSHAVIGGRIGSGPALYVKGRGISNATTSVIIADSSGKSNMVVLDDGSVGIGTAAPIASLEIHGQNRPGLYVKKGGTILSHVAIAAGAAIPAPANVSVVEIMPDGTPGSPNIVALPAGSAAGEVLYFINRDNDALNFAVGPPAAAGTSAMFIYLTSIGGWFRMF